MSALREIRCAADPKIAYHAIATSMPPLVASAIAPMEFESIRQRLKQLPEPPAHPTLTSRDWLGGFGVFLAVFLSTFPVVIPFLLITETALAIRVSNAVAVVMLFLAGYMFGHYAGYSPWRMGLWMSIVGSALVALTVVLGR